MKKILFAIAITIFSGPAFAQHTNRLVNDYIAIKNALVNGDGKSATEAVATFQQTVKSEGDFAQKDALVKATEELAKAGNLEKQRAAFNEVSITLWKTVKSADKAEPTLFYQYCPMKKAYWVSKEKDIKTLTTVQRC